jgi:hypothetical protein
MGKDQFSKGGKRGIGSPARSFSDRGTLGILHIGEKIEGEIIKI